MCQFLMISQAGALEAMVAAMTWHQDEAKVQVWAACN